MKKEFLITPENAKFSPAVMHLAQLLRTAKSHCDSMKSLIDYLTKDIDGKSFTKSEARRIYDAFSMCLYWWEGTTVPGIDKKGKLTFKREQYANNSNFFEEYAKDLIEFGGVIKPMGRPKGYTSDAIKAHCAAMRAKKGSRKKSYLPPTTIVEEKEELLPVKVELPVAKVEIPCLQPLAAYSTEELCHELFMRGYQVNLEYMGII